MSKFIADSEVFDLMRDLVGQHHPDLALVVDEIQIVFKEKASKKGGKPILGKASIANDLISLIGNTPCKFILELGMDAWQDLSSRERKALMDHLLCSCRAEEVDGVYKYSIASPDISYFWDEFDRWKDWRPRPEGDGPDGPSPLNEVFAPGATQAAPTSNDSDDLADFDS